MATDGERPRRLGLGAVIAAAVGVALAASVCYALAAALQQHAAGQAPTPGGARLLAHLLTRGRWLAGVAAMVAGGGLHVLALRLGPLALVQPIGVSGLVFALPLGAALHRHRIVARQLLAAGAVGVGLVGLLASLHVPEDTPTLSGVGAAALAGGTAAAVLACVLVGRRLPPPARAVLFAVGAGIAFGVTSALVRVVAAGIGAVGLARGVLAWPSLILLVAAVTGLMLSQSAYQVGSLAAVLPTVTVVDPLAAISVGELALGEPVLFPGWSPAVAAAAGVLIVAGTVVLVRHQPAPSPGRRADPVARDRRPAHPIDDPKAS